MIKNPVVKMSYGGTSEHNTPTGVISVPLDFIPGIPTIPGHSGYIT